MKKKINIEKKIEFSKMISEITAISLENDLHFVTDDNVEGNFVISGRYKTTVASQLEEDFNYKVPVDISLMEHLDLDTVKIEITDFSYEVADEDVLQCNIELLIDGLELIDDRECDGDPVESKEVEIPKLEDVNLENDSTSSNNNDLEREDDTSLDVDVLEDMDNQDKGEDELDDSLFMNIDSTKETYGTFVVYIVRQNENINTIISKYNTTLEEIEKYNDIKNISNGTKLIIPLIKNEEKK